MYGGYDFKFLYFDFKFLYVVAINCYNTSKASIKFSQGSAEHQTCQPSNTAGKAQQFAEFTKAAFKCLGRFYDTKLTYLRRVGSTESLSSGSA